VKHDAVERLHESAAHYKLHIKNCRKCPSDVGHRTSREWDAKSIQPPGCRHVSLIQIANGAYLDTNNNILTLPDGTKIDTVTGLKLSATT